MGATQKTKNKTNLRAYNCPFIYAFNARRKRSVNLLNRNVKRPRKKRI